MARPRAHAPTAILVLVLALGTPLAGQSTPVETRHTLQVNGVARGYAIYVPPAHRQPAPLVLVFHGGGGRPQGMARHTGFTALAEREGFVVVYPEGVGGHWNDGRSIFSGDDVGFIRVLLDSLRVRLGIDPRRIYATGISNGAMFSYRLACDRPGVLAAIAPVAGALPADLAPRCTAPVPVAVASFQGTADRLVPYDGGGVARRRGQVLSAERSVRFWAVANGCGPSPVSDAPLDRVKDGTRVRRDSFPGCRDGREVVLYTIEGGGHTWPSGPRSGRRVGRVSREIDATTAIWEFFQRHPR